MKKESKKFSKRFAGATISLIIALIATSAATFAWYVFNTGGHTTALKMAAGSTSSLLICNTKNGEYKESTTMDPVEDLGETFSGQLTPVSTNEITKGFQKVLTYKEGKTKEVPVVTDLFQKARGRDYYKSTLFFKSTNDDVDVYVQELGGKDEDPNVPVSTAIRVGFVVHQDGVNEAKEHIFELTDAKNPKRLYNTEKGEKEKGYVIDANKSDGSVYLYDGSVDSNKKLLTKANWCTVKDDGTVDTTNATKICSCKGGGEPTQVDVYIWLEGCDDDCAQNIGSGYLDSIYVKFAGTEVSAK